MTRIYRYILDTDCGMAPCFDAGTISLATCKPGIRKHAQEGDWVAGFWPGSDHRGLLVWAGRVSRSMPTGEYQLSHSKRPDAVYSERRDKTFERLKRGYHCDPKQMERDVGNPVLLFERSANWYFGSSPRELPDVLMHLAAKGQGYRVNFREDGDLERSIAWLFECEPGVHGKPRDELILCPGCVHCADSGAKPRKGCGTRKAKPRKPKRC